MSLDPRNEGDARHGSTRQLVEDEATLRCRQRAQPGFARATLHGLAAQREKDPAM